MVMADMQDKVMLTAGGSQADNLCALMEQLQHTLLEFGCKLEWIKLDNPLWLDGNQVTSLMGVALRDVIYEDEATHWRGSGAQDKEGTS